MKKPMETTASTPDDLMKWIAAPATVKEQPSSGSERRLVRVLIDCPRCGARPPVAHSIGGGPGFDGIRTCGKGCGTWDDDDSKAWQAIRDAND